MKKRSILLSLMLILAASLAWAAPQKQSNFSDVTKFSKGGKTLEIPFLEAKVRVTTDRDGVRHIEAANDHDLAVASGYVHCRDRLFQMDQTRRQIDGTEAELMTPFLREAFDNAGRSDAPIELADLASDPDIIEAVGRLSRWDFSTPTGIPEGYDAKDPNGFRRPGVPTPEARASVAATIYNMWRGQAIRSIIDGRLTSLGLGSNLPGSREVLKALFNFLSQNPYTGVAAAGIDWIPEPATLSAAERRDLALLQALRDALDRLASPEFAPAFGESKNQDDYRWGKLHRIVFEHPFNEAFNIDDFNIPPQAGFKDVAPGLRGLARDGGYEVVNASRFSARAPDFDENIDAFMFNHGPVRRYVGEARTGPGRIAGVNVVPGGPSGIPGDPNYATQLGTWLTADYHAVEMGLSIPPGHIVEKETFVPAR